MSLEAGFKTAEGETIATALPPVPATTAMALEPTATQYQLQNNTHGGPMGPGQYIPYYFDMYSTQQFYPQ